MKLKFAINQAEALRRGIDAPRSTAIIEVDPSTLPQEDRTLLADRMDGINVCQGWMKDGERGICHHPQSQIDNDLGKERAPMHIIANLPTFEELMKAVRADEAEVLKWVAKREAEVKAEAASK